MSTATADPTVEPFVHEGLHYADVDRFLAGTLAFIRAGLADGVPVLIAVPEPRLSLLRAEFDLACAGDDPATVRFVDMADVGRNPNRILPWVLSAFWREHGPRHVRLIGEPLYPGRAPEEIALCVLHEALINIAFAGAAAHLLCPYDTAQLAHVMPYVEWTHPVLVDDRGRRPSANYLTPQAVVALLNQPLPEPRGIIASMAFDARGLSAVRTQIAKVADTVGLAPTRVGDLQLAASEIGSNAVTHTGVTVATMRLWSDRERVVCEIRGGGEILDPLAGRVIPQPDSPRGRGLLVANQLCDLVQTYTGPAGTITRLHMLLSPS